MVVITEGEFKAHAVNQALNFSGSNEVVQAVAVPGISMCKNEACFKELLDLLETHKPSRVVVAYDNEEKGDPRFPSFKQDPRKRHDAQIWARYLCEVLVKEGYETGV